MIWYNSKSQPNLEWYYNAAPSLSRFTLVLPRLGGDAVLAPGLTISACPPGPGSHYPTESPPCPPQAESLSSCWMQLLLQMGLPCFSMVKNSVLVFRKSAFHSVQFLLTFNPGICGLYMGTRCQGTTLRETTGYIFSWWSYSHILTWLLKKS